MSERIRDSHYETANGDCGYCVTPWPCDTERVRAEYQRFYDFVAESDPALVDAWHFTENARASA